MTRTTNDEERSWNYETNGIGRTTNDKAGNELPLDKQVIGGGAVFGFAVAAGVAEAGVHGGYGAQDIKQQGVSRDF